MPACRCPSVWCVLDSALHAIHLHIRWICDRHETTITGGRP